MITVINDINIPGTDNSVCIFSLESGSFTTDFCSLEGELFSWPLDTTHEDFFFPLKQRPTLFFPRITGITIITTNTAIITKRINRKMIRAASHGEPKKEANQMKNPCSI